ncbi:MAG: helix-turn-helix transcriptional regulator [Archangium sp.]|nr:helix-turn-helix transcriptional regulator [Archangium sp.]
MTSQVMLPGSTTFWIKLRASTCPGRMSAIEERLGQKIARLRRAAGHTQAELAERVGLQPEHINRVENGKRGVSIEAIANIADVLGVELHDLCRLQDKDDPKSAALDRLLWFGSRLSISELELVMGVGAAVLDHLRRPEGGAGLA